MSTNLNREVHQSDSSRTVSNWMATGAMPERGPLQENTRTDVCIVGGGIAGLTTAYLLARAGKQVIVLEDGPFGAGETSRTTAHLSCVIDDDFQNIEKAHGAEGLRLAYESHLAAIDTIERIAREENIDCDFARLDGYLFAKPDEDPLFLTRELEAAKRAGFSDAEMVERAPMPGYETGPCIRFPRQGRFHVLKYLSALAAVIEKLGGRLCGGTHVEKMENSEDGKGAKVVTANGQEVTCDAAVACVNSPMAAQSINFKEFPYRTYAIAARVPRGSVPDGLYWDTEDPYHYVRLQPFDEADDLLIIGGEDHKTGEANDAPKRYEHLAAWARERFPEMGEIEFRWSGQVWEPVDGLAYIGRIKDGENLFICTGDSGMGITHGTIAGLLNTDLILGRENPWESLYRPSRSPVRAPMELAGELVHVVRQQVGKIIGGSEVGSEDEIAAGEGAIIRKGLSPLAIYRDESGELHRCSAVCTHMKCIVSWNSEEKSWDCACHGSRFDTDGRPINGPAVEPLAEIEEPAVAH